MGQNYTTRNWTAGLVLVSHIPGFHFRHAFLTHSQVSFLGLFGLKWMVLDANHRWAWVKIKPPGIGPLV